MVVLGSLSHSWCPGTVVAEGMGELEVGDGG